MELQGYKYVEPVMHISVTTPVSVNADLFDSWVAGLDVDETLNQRYDTEMDAIAESFRHTRDVFLFPGEQPGEISEEEAIEESCLPAEAFLSSVSSEYSAAISKDLLGALLREDVVEQFRVFESLETEMRFPNIYYSSSSPAQVTTLDSATSPRPAGRNRSPRTQRSAISSIGESRGWLSIPIVQRVDLLRKFFQFDKEVYREVLGKKISGRLRKDVDDIAAKTGISIRSVKRQIANLRTIYKFCKEYFSKTNVSRSTISSPPDIVPLSLPASAIHDPVSASDANTTASASHNSNAATGSDAPRHSVDDEMVGVSAVQKALEKHYYLEASVARDYAKVVFFCEHRFTTKVKRLQCLSFDDFSGFAESISQNLIVRTIVNATLGKKKYPQVSGGGSAPNSPARSPAIPPSPGGLFDPPATATTTASADANADLNVVISWPTPLMIDPALCAQLRLLRDLIVDSKDIMGGVERELRAGATALGKTLQWSDRKSAKVAEKAGKILKSLLLIGSGLSKSKELDDFFTDLTDDVCQRFGKCKLSSAEAKEVMRLLSGLFESVIGSKVSSQSPELEDAWKRSMNVYYDCATNLYERDLEAR